jgi:hypothetical protein
MPTYKFQSNFIYRIVIREENVSSVFEAFTTPDQPEEGQKKLISQLATNQGAVFQPITFFASTNQTPPSANFQSRRL